MTFIPSLKLTNVIVICLVCCLILFTSLHAQALQKSALRSSNTSFALMSQDIKYLASDQLKGRANFSPEIGLAADYISSQFSQIGLKPFANNKSFKQTFDILKRSPKKITVELNGNVFDTQDLSFVSTLPKFTWNNITDTQISVISDTDDLFKSVKALNKQGGKHLVLVNPSHEEAFLKYQQHFLKAAIQVINSNASETLVLVLTEEKDVKSLKVTAENSIKTMSLTNIVGVIPGTNNMSKSHSSVIFSAHYDHLGLNNKDNAIFNGADDDASGTTAVMQLARYYQQEFMPANNKDNLKTTLNRPTLIFIAFAGEELGALGSRYFSQQLNPDNVTAMFNIEMIGKPSKFGSGEFWITGEQRSNLAEYLNATGAEYNIKVHADPYPKQNLFYRSDNATLARLGVPAHSFSSAQIDIDPHYHNTSDDINSLDLDSMHQVIEKLTIVTRDIAEGKVTPSRIKIQRLSTLNKIF